MTQGVASLCPGLFAFGLSALRNSSTAKLEPDGLGSLAEEIAPAGKFFVPKEQNVTDPSQKQLLLHPTVEELEGTAKHAKYANGSAWKSFSRVWRISR